MIRKLLSLALVAVAPASLGSAPPAPRPHATTVCAEEPGWSDPAEPFHIFGNTWFVGTCGISALLVTSPRGHVLVDGATPEAAAQIAANIAKLGFRLADVKAIVVSHAHSDHVGGLAELQRLTGAPVWSRGSDVGTLQRGFGGNDDPQRKIAPHFPPVAQVREVRGGNTVRVGPVALRAVDTTGHTPGSTSWTWRSCEGRRCLNIAYVDSLTAISDDDYRYSDDAVHPGYLARFRSSIARVASLPCDVLLTPHPGVSAMWERIGPKPTEPLVDRQACRDLSRAAGERLGQRLAREAK